MESNEMCGWADGMKESNEFRSCLLTFNCGVICESQFVCTQDDHIEDQECAGQLRPPIPAGAVTGQGSCSGLEWNWGWHACAICFKTTFPN